MICAACLNQQPLPRSLLSPLLSALPLAPQQLSEALAAWAARSSEVKAASGGLVAQLLGAAEQLEGLKVLRQVGCVLDLWSLDKTGVEGW